MNLYSLLKSFVKQLINILSWRCRSLIIFIPFLFGICDRLCWFHLSLFIIRFISQQKHDRLLQIKPIIFHRIFPSTNIHKTLFITKIKHQQYNLRMLKEWISNLLIIRAATNIEKINSYNFVIYINFFYTVIYADCCDIFVYEFALTISFYYAWFACFCITYWD